MHDARPARQRWIVGTVQLASCLGRPVEGHTCIYSRKRACYITQRISKKARNKEIIHDSWPVRLDMDAKTYRKNGSM
jgi:hypothetical protein